MIEFPYPYQVSKDNYESQQAFGSFRTVVEPSNHPEQEGIEIGFGIIIAVIVLFAIAQTVRDRGKGKK